LILGTADYAGAQKSLSGLLDISELMTIAGERFDLASEDAVLLFDGQRIRAHKDGRYVQYVHRIIWLNTDVAIRRYGDHRIRHDVAHCSLKVAAIRTWRDNQWWETGSTGIVETLPYELAHAYDYANMREMMLLHDGIELPCIIEVAYLIEDLVPFRTGLEGIWTFARNEPVVQSWFGLELPVGWWPNIYEYPATPPPEKTTDTALGFDIYFWKRGPYDALPRPHIADPAKTEPHILWSFWKDWDSLGKHLKNIIDSAAVTGEYLKGIIDSVTEYARNDVEKAEKIAEFINTATRYIDYPEYYWLSSPRSAHRIFSTGYGHRLDRAVLAASLFREAGLSARPVYLGKGYGKIENSVPTLARLGGIRLWLAGDNLAGHYDPAEGTLSNGPARFFNRAVWLPGEDEKPIVKSPGNGKQSLINVIIDLTYSSEIDSLTGQGMYYSDNCFNAYDRTAGLNGKAGDFLGGVISGIIEGAEITEYNPGRLDRAITELGFEYKVEKPETDDLGRLKLNFGQPTGGLFERLPDDVQLYRNHRESIIDLPGPMIQKLEFRIDTKDIEIMYYPEEYIIENEAGSFSISTDVKNDRLSISKTLDLAKTVYSPDEWPQLRMLLLAEKSERNNTLIFKVDEDLGDD
jgi:hypothetical protein